MTKFYVYKITNITNNKIYIGKTNDLDKRWYNHVYFALVNKQKTHFYNAIRKFGANSFIKEIIEECESEKIAFEKEIYWIENLKSNDSNMGYNLTAGGEGISEFILSEESKEKIRQKMLGRTLSEEHKKKISEANKGKIMSDESRDKISIANSGKNNGMFDKTITDETRNKLSKFQATRKRKPLSDDHIKSIKLARAQQDMKFRIPKEIKKEIVDLYKSGQYNKRQLSEMFKLKYNSVVKIIKVEK